MDYNIQNLQKMVNKRYITASRCPMYRWSIFAARSTRLTAWNASCLFPLLLNVKQHLYLSAKPNKWKSWVGNVWLTIPNLPNFGTKTARTVPKLLQAMEAVGISSSQKVGDNRIITLHSLSGWYVDGRFVKNGFSLKRNADGSAIIHTEVPQARVIVTTTEDNTKSDKEDGHSANGISDTDNKGNSSTADISSSLNSTSSNDNRSVGKVGTNGNLSDAVTGGISPQQNYSRQSVGNPSSLQEADAKQNKGEHNTYPQHLAGGQTQQSNGSNANGYKANSYHNGNQ